MTGSGLVEMVYSAITNFQTGLYSQAAKFPQTSTGLSARRPSLGGKSIPTFVQRIFVSNGYPIDCYVLSNGHQVMIEHRPVDIISLRTFVDTGSIVENPMQVSPLYGKTGFPSGIAHLDEHCHFLATQHYPHKNSWSGVVEKLGASYNASTSNEIIQHEIVFNREDLPAMLALHGESVMRPIYKDQDITQEKTNVINEMRQRMVPPEAKVFDKINTLLFDRPGFQTLGSKADVLGTTSADLRRFHEVFYTPDRMVTVISGRVDVPATLALLNRDFGDNPPRKDSRQALTTQLALRPSEIRHATLHDPQLNYSIVHLAFPAPAKTHFKERVAMEFLSVLLGEGPLSLLETEVKNRQRLASLVEVGYMPLKATGSFNIHMEVSPGQEQKTLAATLQTLSSLSHLPVSAYKLQTVRDQLRHRFQNLLAQAQTTTSVMGEEALHGTLPYFMNYMDLLNRITAEDLRQVAQKYLNPYRYAVVFAVPAPQGQLTPLPGMVGGSV